MTEIILADKVKQQIAQQMFSTIHSGNHDTYPAGYTYLGQFISHEIVPSTFQTSSSRRVTGYMDLDSLYGSAPLYTYKLQPESLPFLDKKGRFLEETCADYQHDLPRDPKGKKYIARIPEVRNDENQIIAQLHLLFMRLHNKLLHNNKYAEDGLEARIYTTLLFQLVLIEDFLRKILTTEVYNAIFVNNAQLIDDYLFKQCLPCRYFCFVPMIFSHATWRFGHSNVRNDYHLNSTLNVPPTAQLLKKNSRIPFEHKIEWWRFFNLIERTPNKASKINLHISDQMRQLSSNYSMNNIVHLNLLAAEAAGLPCGQQVYADLLGQPGSAQFFPLLKIEKIQSLSKSKLENIEGLSASNLPLWLYMLLEAQNQTNGITLGPMASLINATVLRRSIAGATISVYNENQYDYQRAIAKLGKALQAESFVKNKQISMQSIINFIEN